MIDKMQKYRNVSALQFYADRVLKSRNIHNFPHSYVAYCIYLHCHILHLNTKEQHMFMNVKCAKLCI